MAARRALWRRRRRGWQNGSSADKADLMKWLAEQFAAEEKRPLEKAA